MQQEGYVNGGKGNDQDYARDYAITLNLGSDLEKKYQNLDDIANGKKDEQLVNIRVRQLAIAKILVKIHGRDPQLLVKGHTHLGHSYLDYKCHDQSYDHLRMALERNREYIQTEQGESYQLYILKLLSRVCLESHRFKEANEYLKGAEEICLENEEEYGRYSKDYAIIKEFKGDYYVRVENNEEAIKCYEEVLEIYEKTDGRESEGYANVLHQLSKIFEGMKDYKMSANYLEECILCYETVPLENKFSVLIQLNVKKLELLSKVKEQKEDHDETVIECYLKIKDLNIEAYGATDKRTLKSLRNLAIAQSKKKRYEDALDTIIQIESAEKEVFGEKSKQIAKTLALKATLLYKIGDRPQAKEILRRAAMLYEELGDKIGAKKVKAKLESIE